jgi:hypothetical protein
MYNLDADHGRTNLPDHSTLPDWCLCSSVGQSGLEVHTIAIRMVDLLNQNDLMKRISYSFFVVILFAPSLRSQVLTSFNSLESYRKKEALNKWQKINVNVEIEDVSNQYWVGGWMRVGKSDVPCTLYSINGNSAIASFTWLRKGEMVSVRGYFEHGNIVCKGITLMNGVKGFVQPNNETNGEAWDESVNSDGSMYILRNAVGLNFALPKEDTERSESSPKHGTSITIEDQHNNILGYIKYDAEKGEIVEDSYFAVLGYLANGMIQKSNSKRIIASMQQVPKGETTYDGIGGSILWSILDDSYHGGQCVYGGGSSVLGYLKNNTIFNSDYDVLGRVRGQKPLTIAEWSIILYFFFEQH